MNKATKTAINKHGEALKQFFGLPTDLNPVELCKKLKRLENKAHKYAEDECNGLADYDEFVQLSKEHGFIEQADKLLNFKAKGIKVFFNGDCRGYALKISDEHKEAMIEAGIMRDWGGYGIIAPDLTQEVKR